jgi:hypothetical protein
MLPWMEQKLHNKLFLFMSIHYDIIHTIVIAEISKRKKSYKECHSSQFLQN